MARVLVTGALGQVGSELVPALRERYGFDAVVASDIRDPGDGTRDEGPFQRLDCTDAGALASAVERHGVDTIYHLAAILSARGEENPRETYRVNMDGVANVLETARERDCAVFVPSSIAAFGPGTPSDPAPQDTVQRPTTIYGVTKAAGELLCDYYHRRFGVDARGVRYPGLISYAAPPGGGTTDYAVDIFHHAVEGAGYTCFLSPDTRLDFMYMPDALRAAIELMEADPGDLEHRNAFNVTAMQLTPAELADEIRRHVPDFEVDYDVDSVRQSIADSWPRRVDDTAARDEWGWEPGYDLAEMTEDMLHHLRARAAGAEAAAR